MTAQRTIRYQDEHYTLIGQDARDTYIESQNSAQCVPLTDSGMVIFIVEPSPAFQRDILTLPGGVINLEEAHDIAANRELQEEIGYRAQQLDYLGEFRPWVKYLHMRVFMYLARHLTPSKRLGDEPYDIATELVPLSDFERLINSGRLHDSTVIAALFMARQFIARERAS